MQTASTSIPERRFTTHQLAKLLEITSEVDCECPNHLSRLVESLVAFENYSSDCESRDDHDRELHAFLHRETAKARALMEVALQELVEAEGISV